MEIRVHFPPLAGELSILCEEDPGPFPILLTRVEFTAAFLPVRIPFFPHSPPSLFAHGAVVKMSHLALGGSVSRGAFGVILLWQWMDKCRRVTVKRQVFQQIHIYSLNTPNPSPLPLQFPLLTLTTPITVFLTKLAVHIHAVHIQAVHNIPIVPCCPLQKNMVKHAQILYCIPALL